MEIGGQSDSCSSSKQYMLSSLLKAKPPERTGLDLLKSSTATTTARRRVRSAWGNFFAATRGSCAALRSIYDAGRACSEVHVTCMATSRFFRPDNPKIIGADML